MTSSLDQYFIDIYIYIYIERERERQIWNENKLRFHGDKPELMIIILFSVQLRTDF